MLVDKPSAVALASHRDQLNFEREMCLKRLPSDDTVEKIPRRAYPSLVKDDLLDASRAYRFDCFRDTGDIAGYRELSFRQTHASVQPCA